MGAMFGFPVVAALPSIQAAVFLLGGIPAGGGIEDPPLGGLLLEVASRLEAPQILMANASHDEISPVEGVHALFEAIPGSNKRLVFWSGGHDWPPEAIDWSVAFLRTHIGQLTGAEAWPSLASS